MASTIVFLVAVVWVCMMETAMLHDDDNKVREPEVVQRPTEIRMSCEPIGHYAGYMLYTMPQLKVYDTEGINVRMLGLAPWRLLALLYDSDGNKINGEEILLGNTAVRYVNGTFKYMDLAVADPGNYSLKFEVISPSDTYGFVAESEAFTVDVAPTEAPTLRPTTTTTRISAMTTRSINIQRTRRMTADRAENGIPPRPIFSTASDKRPWKCNLSLYMPDLYDGQLLSPKTVLADPINWQEKLPTKPTFSAHGQYFLQYRCIPQDCDTICTPHSFVGKPIQDLPVNYKKPNVVINKRVTLLFDANYTKIASGRDRYFANLVHNRFFKTAMEHTTVLTNWLVSEGSILVSFNVGGEEEASVDTMIKSIWKEATTGEMSFIGYTIPPSSKVTVDQQSYEGLQMGNEQTASMNIGELGGFESGIVAIIAIVSIVALVIMGAIIALGVKLKHANDYPNEPLERHTRTGFDPVNHSESEEVVPSKQASTQAADSISSSDQKLGQTSEDPKPSAQVIPLETSHLEAKFPVLYCLDSVSPMTETNAIRPTRGIHTTSLWTAKEAPTTVVQSSTPAYRESSSDESQHEDEKNNDTKRKLSYHKYLSKSAIKKADTPPVWKGDHWEYYEKDQANGKPPPASLLLPPRRSALRINVSNLSVPVTVSKATADLVRT